ncbi:MAG: hypothetical protein ACKPJJ_21720, partial [Planctomycetaceae bacterium]
MRKLVTWRVRLWRAEHEKIAAKEQVWQTAHRGRYHSAQGHPADTTQNRCRKFPKNSQKAKKGANQEKTGP